VLAEVSYSRRAVESQKCAGIPRRKGEYSKMQESAVTEKVYPRKGEEMVQY